jgi:nucleoside-diphosphate-sugar epimerase
MRILVLGGGRFVGPSIIGAAIARGWEVTAFNRGQTSSVPSGAKTIVGDRTNLADLPRLAEERWDGVVDTWSGAPRMVRDAASALASSAERYMYVSSRSVYRWPPPHGADETAPVVAADPDANATDYAADKRGGELAAEREFGSWRVGLLRAGMILGSREDVGRLPWWLTRIAEGGRVLAPGPPGCPLQYVDARDLAQFAVHAIDAGLTGPFNVVSEPGHTTMEGVLESCVATTASDAELVWVDSEFLLEAGVRPWTELPIWVPPGHEDDTIHHFDVRRAHGAGLRCRPIEETVADTWRWMRDTRPDERAPDRSAEMGIGISREREHQLLARWATSVREAE